ncbi:MAG: ABC transporter permease, partial [Bacteroidaceae bacterium]|nr:ABC transporter permease [Bacteroidaceae bacterium]
YDLQRIKDVDSPYPVLVDETVLTWGLMMNMGDTLYYTDAHDNEVKLLIAGTLPNTVLQGNVVIDKSLFAKIWPELTGSEVALVRVNEANVKQTAQLIATALNEYGVRVNTTNDRLRQFYQVTDTYLTIFLSLGGIGLLLGILSFLIVIRKSLIARSSDIQMYAMIGYRAETISQLLFKENVIVPVYAIIVGVTGALLSIGTGFINVSVSIWLLSLLLMLLFSGCVWVFVKRLVIKEVKNKYQ